ncbi:MAG TPA: PQQ-dependent sugar dehydrogenase [Xanthobacteraceae bacterium]|nr:PQQ-dependent sugar dehydrogenase [Xanthobacteraceae bacterium]
MRRSFPAVIASPAVLAIAVVAIVSLTAIPLLAQTGAGVLEGSAAFGDWHADRPGVRRLISPQDLPAPDLAKSARNVVRIVHRTDQKPIVPNGFEVNLFASGLSGPRIIRTAPNGDMFVAESEAGRIRVLRANGGGPPQASVFASGLTYPFGIAFYPPGGDPQWVYVGDTDAVVRFPYRNGDVAARGEAQSIVPRLPLGGHHTRDIAFSPDGKTMYVSVGSATNDGEDMEKLGGSALGNFISSHALGAPWGREAGRADVLAFDPDGKNERIVATGIRNCVGMAVDQSSGTVWCSTNERDGLGDNVPPDYITRVRDGAFYGWPWYYIGANEDPRHRGERSDLKSKITVPDVLIEAHSASLGMTFYDSRQFPPDYRGNVFAAEHGSWNRSKRTGYKIIRVIVKDGVPTGEYGDFATGFVINDSEVWGRPVGVTVDKDGALLISEDASGTIWRIAYTGKSAPTK